MSNPLLKIFVTFIITFFLTYLIHTKQALNYVAPKIIVYLQVAIVILFLIALVNLYCWFNRKPIISCSDCNHNQTKSKWRQIAVTILFVFPVCLVLFTPNEMAMEKFVDAKGIQLQTKNNDGKNFKQHSASNSSDLNERFNQTDFPPEYSKLGIRLYKQEKINITEQGFAELLTTISLFHANYIGKQIEISGFVYREEGMNENQFIVARLIMSCCSADSLPYGVIVHSERAKDFQNNDWIKLVGRIDRTNYNDVEVLAINPTFIKRISQPQNSYIEAFQGNISDLPLN